MTGSIILCGIAIAVTAFLMLRSERKKAAVGRRFVYAPPSLASGFPDVRLTHSHIYREMQLFLLSYIVVEICEIFTVGEFPLSSTVRIVRSFRCRQNRMKMIEANVCPGFHRSTYRHDHRVNMDTDA